MHLLNVMLRFWWVSLAAELEYRFSFVLYAVTSLLGLGGSLFSLWLFYRAGAGFPGYSLDESLIVLGCFTLLTGLVGTWLSPNLSRIVAHVEKGTLDFVLLKPIDAQLHLSVRHVSPFGIPDMLFGFALMGYGATRAHVAVANVAAAGLALLFGVLILYALWFAVSVTSMWFTKIYNATEVLRGLLDAGRYPMSAYPAGYRLFFTAVVPVAFLTTVPADVLLGRAALSMVAWAAVVALLLLCGSRLLFLWALRSYTGASG